MPPVPPESLRMGMGPFDDPTLFLESGRDTLELARRMVGLDPEHRVLDVGCGCGRLAIPMMSFLSSAGTYTGLDIDSACIDWCVENIESHDSRFSFEAVDVHSHAYNPTGQSSPETITFPFGNDVFDRAIVSSVFTHMTEEGITRYLFELHRVVDSNGLALVSTLLMDDAARSAVGRRTTSFSFESQLGANSWTIDPGAPLEGVAVDPAWFHKTARDSGFIVRQIEYGTWRTRRGWDVQHDWLVLADQDSWDLARQTSG